ncbi:MAG: DUF2846 domain-containing protein [Verrucomicrobiia bacterium]|jgi:hypothetical protein
MRLYKQTLRAVVIGLVVLGAIGCASVPTTTASLDAEAKKFVPEPGNGSIYLDRGSGVAYALYKADFLLDGRMAGSLGNGFFLLLSVPPGEHVVVPRPVSTQSYGLFNNPGPQWENAQKINVEGGKNYFYEVNYSVGMAHQQVHLQELTEEQGRASVLKSQRAISTDIVMTPPTQ